MDEPATLERSNSIRSEISDIDVQIPPADARRIQEEVQEMRNRDDGEFILDPTFNSPAEAPRNTLISEIYIDEENQTKWSKKYLMAYNFKTEPFPIRTLSETNRYDLKRFYKYIPKEILKNKEQEHKFLAEKRVKYPQVVSHKEVQTKTNTR